MNQLILFGVSDVAFYAVFATPAEIICEFTADNPEWIFADRKSGL